MAKSLLTRLVFRCFKSLERCGDKVLGTAGPFFIAMAVVLITFGVISWLEIIQPTLPIVTYPLSILIIINLFMHYYYACAISPGFVEDDHPNSTSHSRTVLVDSLEYRAYMLRRCMVGRLLGDWAWAKPRTHTSIRYIPVNVSEDTSENVVYANGSVDFGANEHEHQHGETWVSILHSKANIVPARLNKCKRCNRMRPERAHHCRICNRCVLKFDHHCPVRINQCVGINNERHFVLFMAYLVLSTFLYTLLGFQNAWIIMFGPFFDLPATFLPTPLHLLTYILSLVLLFCVLVLLVNHLYGVSKGETAVESEEFTFLRSECKKRGREFKNAYNISRTQNLRLFFNLETYPTYTLFLPLLLPPYTSGHSWARLPGLEKRHGGLKEGEDEFMSGDEDEEHYDGNDNGGAEV